MSDSWKVERLGDHHQLDAFDSGSPVLDVWLSDHARTAIGHGTRSFVVVDEGTGEVVGYFAVAPHLIARDELPRQLGRGAPHQVPAVLLAKLALDLRLQGRGLGSELLVRALTTIVHAARNAGGKLVLVDAIDEEATAFYERRGFMAIPGSQRRLVMKLSTAAKAFELDWP